tara:strand:+ start:257 stop:973 length:717 start_codon:yes stop_codon:yes gene_type:complete
MGRDSTRWGIPFNLACALIVGIAFSARNEGLGAFQSDIPIIGIALALLLQEIVLVQWLSRDANSDFTVRLLDYDITDSKRMKYLFIPFLCCLFFGIVLSLLVPREIFGMGFIRILSVSMILTLCIDPLMGLKDKGPTAIVGAGLAYVLVLQAGVSGHGNAAEWLSQYVPTMASELISTTVLCYMILSCRWTYYRLFCFEEMEDWKVAAIDTFIPFMVMTAGALPSLFEFFSLIFTGKS